jgi:pimeloyl-ACP methyl ester carboxylesterase
MEAAVVELYPEQPGAFGLYAETCGDTGIPVVIVPGGGADAGLFSTVAEVLASEFRVVTYDRRGNSRSGQPGGWTETSIPEQADDAARLIESMGLTPAFVVGTSWSTLIVIDLIARYPSLLRGAVIHEATLFGVVSNSASVAEQRGTLTADALRRGDYAAAYEALVRSSAGEGVWQGLDSELRKRMAENARVFMTMEVPAFSEYTVPIDVLKQSVIPKTIAAGVVGRDQSVIFEATGWLADNLGLPLTDAPGGHAPYLDEPKEFGRWLQSVLAI